MYDYVIKNNNLEKTVNIIMEIINNEYNLKEAEFQNFASFYNCYLKEFVIYS